jgi:hypothetical protein
MTNSFGDRLRRFLYQNQYVVTEAGGLSMEQPAGESIRRG